MQYLTTLVDLNATLNFAQQIAKSIVPDFVVAVSGDLGAGKTTLVRGVLYDLGVTGNVKSPTYTIVEPYSVGNVDIYHFDLYRFNAGEEWLDSGFDEYFTKNSICFIEWAEKAYQYLPSIDWWLKIIAVSDAEAAKDQRSVQITSLSDKGTECLSQLIKHAD